MLEGSRDLVSPYTSTEGRRVLASFSPLVYPSERDPLKEIGIDVTTFGLLTVGGKMIPKGLVKVEGIGSVIATARSGQLAELLPTSSLSARQVEIHEQLSRQGSIGTFPRKKVSMADLRSIGQVTGDEYSMFTLGSQRTIIRGYGNEISVSSNMLDELLAGKHGKWSGHTHPPGYSITPGPVDRPLLQQMGQQRSAIWGNDGQHVYGRLPSDDAIIQSEIMRARWSRIYGGD